MIISAFRSWLERRVESRFKVLEGYLGRSKWPKVRHPKARRTSVVRGHRRVVCAPPRPEHVVDKSRRRQGYTREQVSSPEPLASSSLAL